MATLTMETPEGFELFGAKDVVSQRPNFRFVRLRAVRLLFEGRMGKYPYKVSIDDMHAAVSTALKECNLFADWRQQCDLVLDIKESLTILNKE